MMLSRICSCYPTGTCALLKGAKLNTLLESVSALGFKKAR